MYKKKFYIIKDGKGAMAKEVDTYNDLMFEASQVIASVIGNIDDLYNIDININNSFEHDGLIKTEIVRMIIKDKREKV